MYNTTMKEFYYGSLRSMKTEYLIRTITEAMPEIDYVEIKHQYEDNPLGDDKVEITSYVDDEDGNLIQLYRETHLSTICYEVAKLLSEVR